MIGRLLVGCLQESGDQWVNLILLPANRRRRCRDFQPRRPRRFSHTDSMDVKRDARGQVRGLHRRVTAPARPILLAPSRHILFACPFTSSGADRAKRCSRSSYASTRCRRAHGAGRPIRSDWSPQSRARAGSACAAQRHDARTRSGRPARSEDASSARSGAPAGPTADPSPRQQQCQR